MRSCSGQAGTRHTHSHIEYQRTAVVCKARKVRDGKQVCATQVLTAKDGHEPQVAKLIADITSYSLQQAQNRSSGVVVWEAVRDAWEPRDFHIWERCESYAALEKHNTSPELVKFYSQVLPHLERPVAMALYEWRNGQLGPACMSEGPKGEGGLDDATGASGAAGGASMQQTSSAFDISAAVREHREEDIEEQHAPAMQQAISSGLKQVEAGLKDLFGSMFGGGGKKATTTQTEDRQPAKRR